jgi:hypothetical protein
MFFCGVHVYLFTTFFFSVTNHFRHVPPKNKEESLACRIMSFFITLSPIPT